MRFEQNHPKDALALLKRMLLVSGEPFESHVAAATLIAKFGHHPEAVDVVDERLQAAPWDSEARLLQALSQHEISDAQQDARTTLIAIASSADAPYKTRADAARALQGADLAATDLGSVELNSIAGRANAFSSAESAPFLYDSLLHDAANTNEAGEKARLFKNAIAARPDGAGVHFDLIQAARAAGDHRLAVATLDPLVSGTAIENTLRPSSFQGDGQQMLSVDDWVVRQFLSRTGWTEEQRREAAFALAASLDALDRPRGAGTVYQIGLLLNGSSNASAEQALEAIRGRIRIQVENASRRPLIHEHLDQENIVRPLITSVEEVSP